MNKKLKVLRAILTILPLAVITCGIIKIVLA